MTFDEILEQVITLLKHQGRVSYRALKMRFDLDDEYLDVLKEELIDAQRIATDEDGRVLVWVGESSEDISVFTSRGRRGVSPAVGYGRASGAPWGDDCGTGGCGTLGGGISKGLQRRRGVRHPSAARM